MKLASRWQSTPTLIQLVFPSHSSLESKYQHEGLSTDFSPLLAVCGIMFSGVLGLTLNPPSRHRSSPSYTPVDDLPKSSLHSSGLSRTDWALRSGSKTTGGYSEAMHRRFPAPTRIASWGFGLIR